MSEVETTRPHQNPQPEFRPPVAEPFSDSDSPSSLSQVSHMAAKRPPVRLSAPIQWPRVFPAL